VLNYLGAYKTLRDLDYTALALANVYGPRQDAHGEAGVVAIFAGNLAASRHSTIFGDGDQTRDFVYVDDVVDAFVRAADAGEGRVFNIGTGAQTSVNDLYGLLAAAAGKLEPPNYAPARTGEVLASALDPSEARALLGWEPRMALRDGLARVLQSQPGFRTLR
jgi:UDP-glucose 4-epimerase